MNEPGELVEEDLTPRHDGLSHADYIEELLTEEDADETGEGGVAGGSEEDV